MRLRLGWIAQRIVHRDLGAQRFQPMDEIGEFMMTVSAKADPRAAPRGVASPPYDTTHALTELAEAAQKAGRPPPPEVKAALAAACITIDVTVGLALSGLL